MFTLDLPSFAAACMLQFTWDSSVILGTCVEKTSSHFLLRTSLLNSQRAAFIDLANNLWFGLMFGGMLCDLKSFLICKKLFLSCVRLLSLSTREKTLFAYFSLPYLTRQTRSLGQICVSKIYRMVLYIYLRLFLSIWQVQSIRKMKSLCFD